VASGCEVSKKLFENEQLAIGN